MCTKDTGVRLLLALTWILSKNVQLRCLLLTALEEAEDESSGLSLNRTDMTPQTRSSQREVEDVGRHWRWLRGHWWEQIHPDPVLWRSPESLELFRKVLETKSVLSMLSIDRRLCPDKRLNELCMALCLAASCGSNFNYWSSQACLRGLEMQDWDSCGQAVSRWRESSHRGRRI